jgi:hypothetical protein
MGLAAIWRNPRNKEQPMNIPHSDALVFFGATGNLTYKKIFPALYAMEQRGHLRIPVIGVARSDWTIDKFRARARASVEQHGSFDEEVFAKFQERLHYIRGDYGSPATYAALRKELGNAAHPLHYIVIPPFVKNAGEDAWGSIGERVESLWGLLKTAIDDVIAKFKMTGVRLQMIERWKIGKSEAIRFAAWSQGKQFNT